MTISSGPRGAAAEFRAALAERVEILNITRPDIVRSIHDSSPEAGVDVISANTSGANLGNLDEFGIKQPVSAIVDAALTRDADAIGMPEARYFSA